MRTFAAWVIGILFCSVALFSQTSSSSDAEKYIKECEKQWAESVASGDTTGIERFIADDFIGVDPDGSHYTKAQTIAETKTAPTIFASNHLNAVQVRFYGDAAVAQGSESWVRHDGKKGRFVWTDTWIRRNGQWQIVAAEDLIAPEPEKKK
jgi:ketosteroid isomerase-like protein